MSINTQCQYDAILGMWKDRGFRLREELDPVDETDKLVCIYFQDKKLAAFHKSKLSINPRAAHVIQQSCNNYWNSQLRHFINEQ